MKMQIIFLFVANPASQMPKSVFLSKLSYEHPADGEAAFYQSNTIASASRLYSSGGKIVP